MSTSSYYPTSTTLDALLRQDTLTHEPDHHPPVPSPVTIIHLISHPNRPLNASTTFHTVSTTACIYSFDILFISPTFVSPVSCYSSLNLINLSHTVFHLSVPLSSPDGTGDITPVIHRYSLVHASVFHLQAVPLSRHSSPTCMPLTSYLTMCLSIKITGWYASHDQHNRGPYV